jgi:hypothetical protein
VQEGVPLVAALGLARPRLWPSEFGPAGASPSG